MYKPRRRRGFTIIEALVAVFLTGVGLVAVLNAINAMTEAQIRLSEKDVMQRLAIEKYEELVAIGDTTSGTSGDFQDYYEDRYEWTSDVVATGIDNLDQLVVIVRRRTGNTNREEVVSGLVFTKPLEAPAGGTP